MANDEIVEKIRPILEQPNPIIEECKVVYLLVEIRKIIERNNDYKKYPLLSFYSCWVVHTRKDKITDQMMEIANEMYEYIKSAMNKKWSPECESPVEKFVKMDVLKDELKEFLLHKSIRPIVIGEEAWTYFAQTLVKVLIDQPMVFREGGIAEISFKSAGVNSAKCIFNLRNDINGKRHFEIMRMWHPVTISAANNKIVIGTHITKSVYRNKRE